MNDDQPVVRRRRQTGTPDAVLRSRAARASEESAARVIDIVVLISCVPLALFLAATGVFALVDGDSMDDKVGTALLCFALAGMAVAGCSIRISRRRSNRSGR